MGFNKVVFGFVLFVAVFLYAVSSSYYVYRSPSKQVIIKTSRSAPPRVAFEEVFRAQQDHKALINSEDTKKEKLESERIINLNEDSSYYRNIVKAIKYKQINLPQLVVHSPESEEKELLISGKITLIGEGFANDRNIEVFRMEEGIIQEHARVDLAKATFELKAESAKGILVAQLVDKENVILSQAKLRISEYFGNNNQKREIKKKDPINLELKPVGQTVTTLSVDSIVTGQTPKKDKTSSAELLYESLGDSATNGDLLSKDSWSYMRVHNASIKESDENKKLYPSLYLVKSEQKKILPTFRDKMIQALFSIVKENQKQSVGPETHSVIWGQVLYEGQPASGVEIEIEEYPEFKPIYFNSILIPDSSLKTTSTSGYFAFVHVPSGFHSLLSKKNEQYFSHVNVPVDLEHISPVKMEASLKYQEVSIRVFDGISGEPASAHVEMQSLLNPIEVEGASHTYLPKIDRLNIARLKPFDEKYLNSQYIYSDTDDYIHFPLVTQEWLQEIKNKTRVSDDPETGVIVGFVPNSDFEVGMPQLPEFENLQKVYFNQKGEIVEDFGPAGGGFVLFNVPFGAPSILVNDKNQNLVHSRVIPVNEGLLSVLKYDF